MTVSNNSTTTCHNPDPLCPSKPKTTLKVPWWCSLFFSLKNGALFGSSLLFLPKITALSVLIPQHWWKFALSTVSMGSREFFPIPVYESIISRTHICKVPTPTCTDSRTSIFCYVGMRCSGLRSTLNACQMVSAAPESLIPSSPWIPIVLGSQKQVNKLVDEAQAECFLAYVFSFPAVRNCSSFSIGLEHLYYSQSNCFTR